MKRTARWSVSVVLTFVWTASVAPLAQSSSPSTSSGLQQSVNDLNDLVAAQQRQLEAQHLQIDQLMAQMGQMQQRSNPAQPPAPEVQSPVASAVAPDPGPSLASLLGSTSVSGFVDAYYNYNANQPSLRINSLRTFDGYSNQIALNLVELMVDKTPDASNSRTGYRIALGFGQAMNVVNASDPGQLGFAQYLKEAYFSYLAPVGKGLQIDVGKFVTANGAEVIETKDNWNYSRGLLFSYAIPYYHFGLRVKYAFSDKYSLTGFLVNGWNNVVENNTGKTYGLSVGWNPTKRVTFAQNYMAGPEGIDNNSNWRQLWDTVATYSPNSKLSFMTNFDYGRGDRIVTAPGLTLPSLVSAPVFWTGAAGYVKYAFHPNYALSARYEYYDDHNGFTTGSAQNIHGFTTTFEHSIASHILSRMEFRRDSSNQPSFVKGSQAVNGQNTATAGVVFMFDSREAR